MMVLTLISEYQIRIISEGLFDTESWSNDDENIYFRHRNKLHFKIYESIKQLF